MVRLLFESFMLFAQSEPGLVLDSEPGRQTDHCCDREDAGYDAVHSHSIGALRLMPLSFVSRGVYCPGKITG